MHHEPYRATRKASAPEGVYASTNVRHPDGRVESYVIPNDVTESDWQGYPAEVRKYVRDAGLHDVKTDDEVAASRAPAAEREAKSEAKAPASQDKTAPLGKSRGAGAKSGQE